MAWNFEKERQHDKMYQDMYEGGNGPDDPSITTRLRILEDDVKRVKDSIGGLKLWALGIIGSVIGDALIHLFKH